MKYKNSIWGGPLEIKESNIKEIKKKAEKPKKVKEITEKSLKSKTVSIQDKLAFIEKEVNRILGIYKDRTEVIRDKNRFIEYIDKAIENGVVAIDTETNNTLDTMHCLIMGVCIYTPGEKNAYIPIHHTDLNDNLLENQLTEADIKEQFSRLKDAKIIMHNAKFDTKVIYNTCDIMLNCYWDTSVACKILDENESARLKDQYIEKIDPSIEKYSIDHLFIIPYNYVSPELFALYAATDSFMTYRLYEWQLNQLKNPEYGDMYNVFMDIEMPIIPVVTGMELRGVEIDFDYASRISKVYHEKRDAIQKEVDNELIKLNPIIDKWKQTEEANFKQLKKGFIIKSGKIVKESTKEIFDIHDNSCYAKSKAEQLSSPIKLESPTQMAILLYDILKVGIIDDSNPRGTGADILEELADRIPICNILTKKRGVDILIDTFIDKIPEVTNKEDGRLHANFNTWGAKTGRFSSSEPNLQNIPSHVKDIRGMFKAKCPIREEQFDDLLIVNTYDELESEDGWVSAKNLKIGDSIKSYDGLITIDNIEYRNGSIAFKFN